MQNKYVADEGDFGKYGLLRTLAGIEPPDEPSYCLGVVWYLWEDSDWMHEAKLDYVSKPDEFRHYDMRLFDKLRDMADRQRPTVKEIKKSEILRRDGQGCCVRHRACSRPAHARRLALPGVEEDGMREDCVPRSRQGSANPREGVKARAITGVRV